MSSFSSWPIKTKEQRARKRVMQKREKKRRQDLLKARNLPFQKYVQFFKCLVQWLLSQLKTAQTGLRRFPIKMNFGGKWPNSMHLVELRFLAKYFAPSRIVILSIYYALCIIVILSTYIDAQFSMVILCTYLCPM